MDVRQFRPALLALFVASLLSLFALLGIGAADARAALTLDTTGCAAGSMSLPATLPPFQDRTAVCDVAFGDSVGQATLRIYQQDGAGAAMAGIDDYDAGLADWDVGPSMFGACLESLSAGTPLWTEALDGDCSTSTTDTWNPIAPTSAGASVATSTPATNETASLRFGVRVDSTVTAGSYTAPVVLEAVAVTVNTPPDVPGFVGPADSSLVPSTTPTLTATFSDVDGDTGLVRFEVCSDPGCSSVVRTGTSASSIASGANGSWVVGPALSQSTTYYWRARSEDAGAAISAWTAVHTFTVNGTTAPTLTNPGAGATITTTTPTLSGVFNDPDVGQTGTLQFRVTQTAACTSGGFTGSSAAGVAIGGAGTWTTPALAVGDWYYCATSTDNLGMTSALSLIRTFTVNGTSVPALNSPTAGATVTTTTPTLSANFTDPNPGQTGTITFRVTQTAACTSGGSTGSSAAGIAIGSPGTWTTPALAAGVWYYCATSTDSAGVSSALSLIRTFTVNGTSVPTLNSPAAGGTVTTTTPVLSADFNDPNTGQTGTIDFRVTQTAACTSGGFTGSSAAGIAIGSPGTWTTPALAVGVWYYCATSTDSAGVASALSLIRSFTVNGTSVPTLNSPAAGGTVTTTTPTLSADFNDPDAGQTGTINFRVTQTAACTSGGSTGSSTAGVVIGTAGTWTTPALAVGVWYYCATSTDSAGVTSTLSLIRSFTVNGTSVPTLNSPAAGATLTSTTPTLSANFNDPDTGQTGTINFRVTQTAACTSGGSTGSSAAGIAIGAPGTWTTPALAVGVWYYCATSTDSAGSTSALSLIRTFTVNGTSVPTLNSPAAGGTVTTTTPTLSADFNDPNPGQTGTINFRVTQTAACTSGGSTGSSAAGVTIGNPGTWTTPALAVGVWYYCATSTDSAGVTSALSSINTFTVNGTSVPTLNSPAAGATTGATPTLDADFNDPNTGQTGTINFRVTQTAACTSGGSTGSSSAGIAIGNPGTWTTPTLSSGTWYWCATSTDSAGVTSALSAIRSFTVTATTPTIVASSQGFSGSGTLTLSKPAGVVAGTLLVAGIADDDVGGSYSAPAGWTLIRQDEDAPSNRMTSWYKIATGSEPASYAFGGGNMAGGIVAFSGANTTTPINAQNGLVSSSGGSSVVAPSVTTTVPNTVLLCIFYYDNDQTMTMPGGMTERFDTNDTGGIGIGAGTEPFAGIGATGTRTAISTDVGIETIGHTIAIRG